MLPNNFSTEKFEAEFTYLGNDLGANWTKERTVFRLWAPSASKVLVNLYRSGDPGADDLICQIDMVPDVNGTWIAEKYGDQNGVYYTYQVTVMDLTREACDPYARTTGVNGRRAMIIDLRSTDPEGWETDCDPHTGCPMTDAVIYELHVRDLSIDKSSGIKNKGKFLGLIEEGTKTADGIPTGLDHMKALGITHLHILPMYDYGSVDESRLDVPQFNWGYDPVNFNVPEGSYSTDPYHGEVRVKELKQTVKGLHDNGISVIMDVVYNHVYDAGSFCFNQIAPVYFSRTDCFGKYANDSGCGNDTASERSMVRKYIVDSVKYWADEYHIDGFRFDLVGLIDIQTINELVTEVHKTHPNVIFYGEGWEMATGVTKPDVIMATKANSRLTPGFGYFSDDIRDLLKGSVFINDDTGYVSGKAHLEALASACFMADLPWCVDPAQTINYASCHDNMALWDRLAMSCPKASFADRVRMNNLAAAFYMTAQGVPFLQAGEEMLRSKPNPDGSFEHNSYRSPDSVNSIKWNDLTKKEYQDVLAYYQGLIAFRKAFPSLRMTTKEQIHQNIELLSGLAPNVTAFRIHGEDHDILAVFNPNPQSTAVTLPDGNWNVYVNDTMAGDLPLASCSGIAAVAPISALMLVQETRREETSGSKKVPLMLGGIAAAAAALGAAVAVASKKRKK